MYKAKWVGKMETAFVFGAGASAAEGASTLTELLKNAFSKFPNDSKVRNAKHFIQDLFPVEFATWRNVPSFEEILTPIDIALSRQDEISEEWNINELSRVRNDLIYCICRTLSEELKRPKNIHRKFVNHLSSTFLDFKEKFVFLSLNYDILLDNALADLYDQGVDLDYGIEFRNFGRDWERPRLERAVLLLKLHGSLNWLFCPVCDLIKITPREKGVMKIFTEFEVCETDGAQQRPFIVPPTWQKAYDNPYLGTIWLKAEGALMRANRVYFIGYSLPESDIHIRYLLKRSLYRKREKILITVVDKERKDGSECEARYERMFHNVTYLPIGFEKFAENLDEYLTD
jgi:hypothetical protein